MMIINKGYVSSLLILLTVSCAVLAELDDWPPIMPFLEGCQGHLIDCKIKYHCRNYLNNPHDVDQIHGMYDQYDCKITDNIDVNYPIHLRYEFPEHTLLVPDISNMNYYGNNVLNSIIELDLSKEGLIYIPEVDSLNNLAIMNLSRNFLTEVKLYNAHELTSLTEIDCSYNEINAIEVREDLYVFKYLRKLNISHNFIDNIPNNIFELFKDMEVLDISYNNIDILNSLTFDGLKNLLNLNLSHNRIVDIGSSLIRFTKITDLDFSFNKLITLNNHNFEYLNEIQSLDLSNNDINTIQSRVFRNLTSLTYLDLSHNELNEIDKDMFQSHVYLKRIDLSSNNIRSLPKFLFKNKTLSQFLIQDNNLEGSLISGMFEGMGLVTDLDLSHQYYATIKDMAFIGIEKLKNLNLKQNEIASLGRLCFKTLINLITLDLSSNRIVEISFDKSDLSNLRELYIQNNYLTEISPDSFTNLQMLEILDISDNRITVLQPHLFSYIVNIKNIEIKGNPLAGVLQDGTFNDLSLLPKLDISGTSINIISNNSFKDMSQLKVLNISHSNVSELQFNAFQNTVAIELLDLSFNKLNVFEINSTALINLAQLLLKNNVLTFVSPFSLKNLPRLNTLILSQNNLKLLEKNIFVNHKDLRFLDISCNSALKFDIKELELCPLLVVLEISSIKTDINFKDVSKDVIISQLHMSNSEIKNLSALSLGKLRHVEELFLDHNEVRNVMVGDFYNLSSLRILDLSYNNISYIQPGAFKDNIMLYSLNASHNNLLSVSYGIFRGLNYLSVIDFSFNIIESIESERFFEVRGLKELYVDHNNIKIFKASDFLNTNLAKLSIGDNPIPCNVLVKIINMHLEINLTAIHRDDSYYENVNGITCNRKHQTNKTNKDYITDDMSDKILTEIKKLMQNQSKYSDKNEDRDANVEDIKVVNGNFNSTIDILSNLSSNIVNEIKKNTQSTTDIFSNLTSNIVNDTNNTNILLNKILTALATEKRTSSFMEPKDIDKNGSYVNILSYLKATKLDLQDEIAKEKASILLEIDKKITSLITSKESVVTNASFEKHFIADEESHSNSLTFVEICLGLIVTILVGFIIFKVYMKRNFFTAKQTYSTRNLPDALDNSTL